MGLPGGACRSERATHRHPGQPAPKANAERSRELLDNGEALDARAASVWGSFKIGEAPDARAARICGLAETEGGTVEERARLGAGTFQSGADVSIKSETSFLGAEPANQAGSRPLGSGPWTPRRAGREAAWFLGS